MCKLELRKLEENKMKKQKMWRGLIVPLILMSMAGCQSTQAAYQAGTYEGIGKGKNGDVKVEVTLSKDKIEKVQVLEHHETQDIAEAALEKIPANIVKSQTTNVDAVAGATVISDAIKDGANDALIKAGVDPAKLVAKETKEENKEIEQIETDVVVIGAGAAGSAAALTAKQNGVEVVLLEKTAKPMGAGTLAGGMFAADSKQQVEENATVDKEWLYDRYKEASQGHMNSILVREIIDNAGQTVDWLNENGAKMSLVQAGAGGGYEHRDAPTTLHGYQEGGTVAITNLVNNLEQAGGKVYFSTPATELRTNKEGKVIGVKAKKEDGSTLEVTAKSVILACGGYGGNQEMLDNYLGTPNTQGEIAHNTGDGLQMAWSAGAGKYGTGTTQYFWETFKNEEIGQMAELVGGDWFALNAFSAYPNLRVNIFGQRFSDETDASLYSVHGAEIASQPKQTEYVIFDQGMLDTIKESGTVAIEDTYGRFEGNRQFFYEFNEPNDTDDFIKRQNTPTDFTPLLDQLTKTGVVFKANSVSELAEQMGMDGANLSASVTQYNTAKAQGKDDLFFSDPERMISVSKGPFYAVKYVARNLGTLGGVRINDQIQAVTPEGEVVDNLYVAGADAGGMYGSAYVDFEGGTLGFAYTSGRLAGKNAAESIK